MTARFLFPVIGLALLAVTPASAQSLDDVIAAAMEHSPQLAAAKARESAADARLDGARAERGPSLRVEGQVGVGRLDPQGYFGLSAGDVTPRSAQAVAEFPIWTGGRVAAAERQAGGGRDIARLETAALILDLRVQVTQAYASALAAHQLVQRYEHLQASLDEVVRQAGLRFKAGEGTSTETAQAQARRAEAAAGLAQAQGQVATANARLAALTGMTVAAPTGLPGPPATPLNADDAVDRAVAGNPRLQQARKATDVAQGRVDAARAERMPTIGAFAEAATVRDQFFPGYKANSATVGLRGRWTLFSGGRNAASIRAASADVTASEADARGARQAVEEQAIEAFEAVRTARAVLDAARARVAATEAALGGTRLEVKVGAKPQLALLDAEREAIEAESMRISAEGQLIVASYRLRAIAGMD